MAEIIIDEEDLQLTRPQIPPEKPKTDIPAEEQMPDFDLSRLSHPDAPTPNKDQDEDVDKLPEVDLTQGRAPVKVPVTEEGVPAQSPEQETAVQQEAAVEALTPEQLNQLNNVEKYAGGTRAREQERLEQRYGKGFIGKTRAWLNNTGWGRAVKIAGKIVIGTGAAVAATALTGGIGLIAAPIIYSLGAKTAIDGALESAQYYLGKNSGRNRRLSMESANAALHAETEKNYVSIGERLANGELSQEAAINELNELAKAINERETQIVAQENDNIKVEAKQKMIRGILSTVATIGLGVLGGVPLGIQDFDKDGVEHAVKLTTQGGIFLQNATNAIHALGHALPAAAKFGIALGIGGLLAKTASEVFGRGKKLQAAQMPQLIDPMHPEATPNPNEPTEPNEPTGPDKPPPVEDSTARVETGDATPEASALPEAQPLFEKPAEFSGFLKEIRERAYNLRQELAEIDVRRQELDEEWQKLDANSNRHEDTDKRKQEIEEEHAQLSNRMNEIMAELSQIRDTAEMIKKMDEIDQELTELDQEWDTLDKKADSDKTYDEKQRISQIVDRHEELAKERSGIREMLLETYNNWGKTGSENPAAETEPETTTMPPEISTTPDVILEDQLTAPEAVVQEIESTEPSDLDITSLESIRDFAEKQEIESRRSIEQSLDKVLEVLKGKEGIVKLKENVPTVVIPDLHGRRDMLFSVLNETGPDGRTYLELLQFSEVNMVVLGDAMHTENATNWRYGAVIAERDNLQRPDGIDALMFWAMVEAQQPPEEVAEFNRQKMVAEMTTNLGVMKLIMELKAQFPETFHYLRGNHDDITGRNGFAKYSSESKEVQEWIRANYGEEAEAFLAKYAEFEDNLPLVTEGNGVILSHAAPDPTFSREAINNREENAVYGITWNDNTSGAYPAVGRMLIEKAKTEMGQPNAVWIIGHRPVNENNGRYRSQFAGQLIQINNPRERVFAVVGQDGRFNPERDIRKM